MPSAAAAVSTSDCALGGEDQQRRCGAVRIVVKGTVTAVGADLTSA